MRERLLNRHGGYNLDFEVPARLGKGAQYFTALLGFDNRQQLREVFIKSGKTGTDVNIVMEEAGVALSFALQHGADPAKIKASMPRTTEGIAEGPLGRLLDLIANNEFQDLDEDLLS